MHDMEKGSVVPVCPPPKLAEAPSGCMQAVRLTGRRKMALRTACTQLQPARACPRAPHMMPAQPPCASRRRAPACVLLHGPGHTLLPGTGHALRAAQLRGRCFHAGPGVAPVTDRCARPVALGGSPCGACWSELAVLGFGTWSDTQRSSHTRCKSPHAVRLPRALAVTWGRR